MSQILINDYLKQLDPIKRVGGSSRETIVREVLRNPGTPMSRRHADGTSALPITKEAIFHYCSVETQRITQTMKTAAR